MSKMLFEDLLYEKDGLIKGPFGGDIKKSIFVSKSENTYKVYEQGIVLKKDIDYGDYYVSKEYFERKLKRFEVNANDILLTGAGTLGELFIVPQNAPKGIINQALLRVRLNGNIVTRDFFVYYFKYYIKSIISNINGDSVIPNLPPLSIIKSTIIDIPDIPNQQKIASVLSSLDSKIELNNRINAELEAMAKTLYDYWFVQFDFPDTNGKPYKTSGGKMVWNEKLKREIPEGWEMKDLADVATTIMRGISPSYREEGGICVLNQKCIRDQSISFAPSRRHDNELKDASSRLIEYGDVLVNSTGFGTLGRVAIVKRLKEPITVVDSHITIVRSESENIRKLFLGYSMLIRQSEIEGLAEGSTGQTELSRVNLGKLKMVIPPIELQSVFENFINPQFQKMANNEAENEQLSELRDWLLPMLMNGQVTVGETKENLDMAAEPKVEYNKQ
ncbi:MAG: restriction endonuclease subunit S [Prolixibacteraceae bacterium]|nr:restriction endonuclease subunit S [Prolixibacteraceae bacterium]